MLKVTQPGLLASIQDGGRRGLRHLGIPWAGTLAPHWMALANALVGNPQGHAVVECFEGGFCAEVLDQPARIALMGDATVLAEAAGQSSRLACWQSHTLAPGTRLQLRTTGRWRLAILALEGLSIAAQYGSCSTYTRARLGGLAGVALQAGDTLRCTVLSDDARRPEQRYKPLGREPLAPADDAAVSLRCVPGPQADAFTDEAVEQFFSTSWQLTTDNDRMGARLAGPALIHRSPAHRQIVSDAIVPGSVQVPGTGLPIIMLADAHTAGGYPKIGTVISSDLATLALYRPGATVHFSKVSVSEAISATRSHASALQAHVESLHDVTEARLDVAALFESNLIDGVTDGGQ